MVYEHNLTLKDKLFSSAAESARAGSAITWMTRPSFTLYGANPGSGLSKLLEPLSAATSDSQ
ncbi:hypothetical protein ACLK19_14820 [Escherichia coli]